MWRRICVGVSPVADLVRENKKGEKKDTWVSTSCICIYTKYLHKLSYNSFLLLSTSGLKVSSRALAAQAIGRSTIYATKKDVLDCRQDQNRAMSGLLKCCDFYTSLTASISQTFFWLPLAVSWVGRVWVALKQAETEAARRPWYVSKNCLKVVLGNPRMMIT